MTDQHDFDLFVIGGGSGGVRAARIAAQHGARVAIAEESRFGGTCVIRGCVPKKLMVYAGRFRDELEDAAGFGWDIGASNFNWQAFRARSDQEIARLEHIYRGGLEKAGVFLFDERAIIEDQHQVTLTASRRLISAKTILVATGSRPSYGMSFPGADLTITSDDVFKLDHLPSRLLFVGGGYIAIEFASIFAHLGSSVTICHRAARLLRGFDGDIVDSVEHHFRARGIGLLAGATVESIETVVDDGLAVSFSDGSHLQVDAVVLATGRTPNTARLGLDRVGIDIDSAGAIPVDSKNRTVVPSIYALGDVINRHNLTPVAIRDGHRFADQNFADIETNEIRGPIATAVFSTPEIGTVGMSEESARLTHPQIRIFKTNFTPMRSGFSRRDARTLMKLVVDAETDRILGVHVVGNDAGEIIQMASVAITMGATKADFDRTVAVHPTASEELVTMRRIFSS